MFVQQGSTRRRVSPCLLRRVAVVRKPDCSGRYLLGVSVSLAREAARTVERDLCTGCGVCVALTSRIAIGLDAKGFARPVVSGSDTPRDTLLAKSFWEICPGIARFVPERNRGTFDPIFGPCVAAFVGHASDPEIRFVEAVEEF